MGNSKDRRKDRRVAERVAAILAGKRPRDILLACASAAGGILFSILPKTPETIAVAFAVIFSLLVLLIWSLLSKHRKIKLATLVGLALLLLWVGATVWPKRFFPWLVTNQTLVDRGKTVGLYLQFYVRETTQKPGSTVTPIPLHNVQLTVTSPVLRSDVPDAWHECEIVNTSVIPEWSNYNGMLTGNGILRLSRNNTLLRVDSTASNGRWSSVVLLTLVNGKMESRQVLDGLFFDPSMHVHIDESTAGFPMEQRDVELEWGSKLFSRYGVPATSRDQIRSACPSVER